MNDLVTYFCTAYELKKIDKPKNELYFSYQRFKCAQFFVIPHADKGFILASIPNFRYSIKLKFIPAIPFGY